MTDDNEPVTEEWLRTFCYVNDRSTFLWWEDLSIGVNSGVWHGLWALGEFGQVTIPPVTTRGDFRTLCRLLGFKQP